MTTFHIEKCLSGIVILFCLQCAGLFGGELSSQEPVYTSEALMSLSLEELMEIEVIPHREAGGFAAQLQDEDAVAYVHFYGDSLYRDNDFNRGRDSKIFDMHYFNIMIGANIEDRIIPEILLEYEHGGDDIALRYSMIDFVILEPLVLRVGKFLVPMGKFNEYYTPEYLNKLSDRPYPLWKIVPLVWGEVGVQIRGDYELTKDQSINYAFYVVNGLEQSANPDGTPGEGGDIRSMRNNFRDYNDDDKAYGGRIGFRPMKSFEVGLSYYNGAYTTDGERDLSIMNADIEFRRKALTLWGEYVKATQEVSSGDLNKDGFYAEAAYRVNRFVEPVYRFDQADLDDGGNTVQRSTLGLTIYPTPGISKYFQFKVNKSIIHDDGTGGTDGEFVVQCAFAF